MRLFLDFFGYAPLFFRGGVEKLRKGGVECCGFDVGMCDVMALNFYGKQRLNVGEFLCSPNRVYQFGISDEDGRLRLCLHNFEIWSADENNARKARFGKKNDVEKDTTSRGRRKHLALDESGGLELSVRSREEVGKRRKNVWTAKTSGHPGALLLVDDRGFAAVRYFDEYLWRTDNSLAPSAAPTISSLPTAYPTASPTKQASEPPTTSHEPTGSPTPAPTPVPSLHPTRPQRKDDRSCDFPARLCASNRRDFEGTLVLESGSFLCSDSRAYRLGVTAADRVLVLCHHDERLWTAPVRFPRGGNVDLTSVELRLRLDGELVLDVADALTSAVGADKRERGDARRNGRDRTVIWTTRTTGYPGARVAVSDDGRFSLTHAGRTVWTAHGLTNRPSAAPTLTPSTTPSDAPTFLPTAAPTSTPTSSPTTAPSSSSAPSTTPTSTPTVEPTSAPSFSTAPSDGPSATFAPTADPTARPTGAPTASPTTTSSPSKGPTVAPTPRVFHPDAEVGRSCAFDERRCAVSNAYFADVGRLSRRQFVCSDSHKYQLGLTADGNLVLCYNRERLWIAQHRRHRRADMLGMYVEMRRDGNFVVVLPNVKSEVGLITVGRDEEEEEEDGDMIIWSTRTSGNPGAKLVVDNTGFAAIVAAGNDDARETFFSATTTNNNDYVWISPNTVFPSASPTVSFAPTTPLPTLSPTDPVPSVTPSRTEPPTVQIDVNSGFYNELDVCELRRNGICPCYIFDDDAYCDGATRPWLLRPENIAADANYGKCDVTRFPTCSSDEKLCPMRKPRLDRYHGDYARQDVWYYVDYDCIRCVPKWENCSQCSPGIWCDPIRRCVGPSLAQWCRNTFPDADLR